MDKQLLCEGVNLCHIPSSKFKTASVSLYIYRPLVREQASKNALLTQILRSATARYPTRADLAKALENLYGATMDCQVRKKGEAHILAFCFEAPSDRYTGPGNLKGLAELALQVVFEPKLSGGILDSGIVEIEKENLKNQILAMINEKRTYSIERCIQEMCADEAFGVYELGSIEDIGHITPQSLTEYYREIIKSSPVDIFVTGDADLNSIKALFTRYLTPRGMGYPKTALKNAPDKMKEVTEEMDVSQGKLVIGCRSGLDPSGDHYYSLLVYNSIFGGGPHSKLFSNVREKQSLAYYAFSRLLRHKGIIIIGTGIEFENFNKARDEIFRQMDAMARGEISSDELHAAKAQLVNSLKAFNDSPISLEDYYVGQSLIGTADSVEDAVKKVEGVTLEQVVAAAATVKPDTLYFLKNKGGERNEA